MTTRVVRAFLLKGVDPNVLIDEYQSGNQAKSTRNKCNIKIAQSSTILAPTYGTSNLEPIFTVKDKNNSTVIIATTSHENFEVFTRTGGNLPAGGRCDLCKEDFTETAIGYPLQQQESTVLVNDDTGIPRYRILYTFWVEGEFCSFECAGGWIDLMLSHPSNYRDTTVRDSGRMLSTLYTLMHPTAGPLRHAQDPHLLKSRKGSLTKEQWKDNRHVYIRTDRILMIPAKVEYVQQNFHNPINVIDYTREANTIITTT